MGFNSLEFLVLAVIALTGHALLDGKPLRLWLLFMSYVFYGWGHPWWVMGLLVASNVLDYTATLRIEAAQTEQVRKFWLMTSIIGNLGLLAVFKYSGFFMRILNRTFGLASLDVQLPVPHILLPPGISFYTFQTMSYTIDVYRRRIKPTHSFVTMATFVAYFPTLVAGPIERATDLMDQLEVKKQRTPQHLINGMTRILWGLTKKVVFADWLGVFVHGVFAFPDAAAPLEIWLATYAFALQIYLDFSAYTDIAAGLANMMGVDFVENFQWPYLARSIAEFWKRWHISFSTWLRDYLYIPLGGSRKGVRRTVINLFIVMFLGGLWHGAATTFILWGLWIGMGLALYHVARHLGWVGGDDDAPFTWKDTFGVVVTFHFICISWVFFRAASTGDAFIMLRRMLWPFTNAPFNASTPDLIRTMAMVVCVGAFHVLRGLNVALRWEKVRSPWAIGLLWGAMAAVMALFFAPVQGQFIYFQF